MADHTWTDADLDRIESAVITLVLAATKDVADALGLLHSAALRITRAAEIPDGELLDALADLVRSNPVEPAKPSDAAEEEI